MCFKNTDGILNVFHFQFLGTLGIGCSPVSSYNDLLQRFKNGSRVCCFEGLFLGFIGLFITWLDETSRAFSCPSSICVANGSQSNNSQRHAADNHTNCYVYHTKRFDLLVGWQREGEYLSQILQLALNNIPVQKMSKFSSNSPRTNRFKIIIEFSTVNENEKEPDDVVNSVIC